MPCAGAMGVPQRSGLLFQTLILQKVLQLWALRLDGRMGFSLWDEEALLFTLSVSISLTCDHCHRLPALHSLKRETKGKAIFKIRQMSLSPEDLGGPH